jgi:hypothetical protein
MPRRNRPKHRRTGQKGKQRPRSFHHTYRSQQMKKTSRWLNDNREAA